MRLLKSLSSTVLLALLLVGVPVLLWRLASRWQLFSRDWLRSLTAPDDGSLLLLLLVVAAWLSWLALTLSVLAELIERLSRGRVRIPLPGLGWLRPIAGVLVGAALMGAIAAPLTTLGRSTAASGPEPSVAPQSVTAQLAATPDHGTPDRATPDEVTERDAATTHVVGASDDLWDLAERYYGDGSQWRRIVQANPGIQAQGPLQVGVRLRLPGAMPQRAVTEQRLNQLTPPAPAPAVAPGHDDRLPLKQDHGAVTPDVTVVTVKAGDTLSKLAEQWLGDPDRWPEIHRANLDLIADPDQIDIGWRLTIPTDHVRTDQSRSEHPRPPVAPPIRAHSPGLAPQSRRATDAEVPVQSRQPLVESAAPEPKPTLPDPGVVQPDDTSDHQLAVIGALGVTSSLATLIALAWSGRRRVQLGQRPVGRRLMSADEPSARFVHAIHLLADEDQSDQVGWAERSQPPTTVVLGDDSRGRPVLLDLADAGITVISGSEDARNGLLGGVVTSLACAEWSAGVTIRAVGSPIAWASKLDHPGLVHLDLDQACRDWESIGAQRRAVAGHGAAHELVQDVLPEVLVIADPIAADDRDRLIAAMTPGMALVLSGVTEPVSAASTQIRVTADRASVDEAAPFVPLQIGQPARRALIELSEVSATLETRRAPWWASAPPDDIPVIHNRPTIPHREEDEMLATTIDSQHPVLLVLGSVEVIGAKGTAPARATKQCAEYCGWILQHPGRTSSAMGEALLVAEGTRRSNMSRLRSWLGSSQDGDQYLPEAYSGRISLDRHVTSDWEHLQLLVAGGVNLTHSQGLVDALGLVRGEPFADAAPGQWHWADEWRTDMISTIRDIAVVLGERSLASDDLDTARWAVSQGRLACQDDEFLSTLHIRIESAAGNRAEVEREVLALARRAREAGVDLLPETVATIQQVVAGRRRSQA